MDNFERPYVNAESQQAGENTQLKNEVLTGMQEARGPRLCETVCSHEEPHWEGLVFYTFSNI